MPDTDPFWTVVHCYSLQEQRAVDNLRRQGFDAFSPTLVEHRVGRSAAVRRATFPGYIFLALVPDYPWAAVNSTPGVIRLLTSSAPGADYRVPQPVPGDFINSLRACLEQDRTGAEVLGPGTRVRVRRGVLAGHEALVRWSVGERLGLLFQILQRDTEIEFALADVEVVEGV